MWNNGYSDPETWPDSYPSLRESLASEYATMEPEEIEALVEQTFGPAVSADDMEGVFGSLGQFAGQVGRSVSQVAGKAAPVMSRALPGAAQGAISGAALGPWGMLGGALLGGVGSTLGGQRGAMATVPGSGAAQLGTGTSAPPSPMGGAGVPAAGQLLNLLGRPEVLHALQAMLLSPIGKTTVPVGGTPVPVGAFTNLLAQLANQAQAQFTAAAGPQPQAIPEYLMESSGECGCDPADPGQRAEMLWQLLQQSDWPNDTIDDFSEDDETLDDYYDAIEMAELN